MAVVKLCSVLDFSAMQTKKLDKLNNTMLYPYLVNSDNNKHEPFMGQTDYITLNDNIYCKDKFITIRKHIDAQNDLFDFIQKCDKFMLSNGNKLLGDCRNISEHIEYNPLITFNKTHDMQFIKMKLNVLFSKINIFFKNETCATINVADINKYIHKNTKLRFILYINKLWYSTYSFGLIVKVQQIEIDNSHINLFSNIRINGYISKKKIESENEQIINIVSNGELSLFDTSDYIPFSYPKLDIHI